MTITNENRYTGGKSFKKHYFTLQDIAEARGKTLGAVRKDIARKKFDPSDLQSLAKYLNGDSV